MAERFSLTPDGPLLAFIENEIEQFRLNDKVRFKTNINQTGLYVPNKLLLAAVPKEDFIQDFWSKFFGSPCLHTVPVLSRELAMHIFKNIVTEHSIGVNQRLAVSTNFGHMYIERSVYLGETMYAVYDSKEELHWQNHDYIVCVDGGAPYC